MPSFILGVAMVVFSLASAWDSARITSTLRVPGAFDLIGPDRYLLGIAILIGALGAGLMLQSLGGLRHARVPGDVSANPQRSNHLLLIATLLGYAALMPIVGYIAATIGFFLVTFWIMGVRSTRWIVPSAVVATAGFYVAFVKIADMALPKGLLGLG